MGDKRAIFILNIKVRPEIGAHMGVNALVSTAPAPNVHMRSPGGPDLTSSPSMHKNVEGGSASGTVNP